MLDVNQKAINNNAGWMPINNFPPQKSAQPSVAISTPNGGRQVYQYPQTSIYNDPNKTAAQGLNIYVFNPSGIGAPSTFTNNNYGSANNSSSIPTTPIANTPISKKTLKTEKEKKTKNIVKLTNDYIKTLEGYLRSADSSIRKQGIQDLVKRFEEDDSRYDNPSLTALLNIALQDPDVHNRMIAISPISAGSAHGDINTVELLKMLSQSDEMYGQEAKMASKAMLKSAQTKEKIIDNSNSPVELNEDKELKENE